jgi:hypothetical protein
VIDYILAFPDQTTAKADPVVGAYFVKGAWRGDVCIPGLAVTVLGTSQPMTITMQDGSTQTVPGPDQPLDALWRIAIGLPARAPVLDTHPSLEIVADRALASSGTPLASYILYSNVPLDNLKLLAVSPSFAGSHYVYGGT